MGKLSIQDPLTAKLVGWAVFITGAILLKDAYDNRGHDQPFWMRPVSFW